jgi:hypothetical protein
MSLPVRATEKAEWHGDWITFHVHLHTFTSIVSVDDVMTLAAENLHVC